MMHSMSCLYVHALIHQLNWIPFNCPSLQHFLSLPFFSFLSLPVLVFVLTVKLEGMYLPIYIVMLSYTGK